MYALSGLISGVGEIVFLHAFPLPDIQCYWYRLRHPYPDKVIWNHCRIKRRKQIFSISISEIRIKIKYIPFLGTWGNSPTPPTRVWIIQQIWYVFEHQFEWIGWWSWFNRKTYFNILCHVMKGDNTFS